jgi:hypothetical protein
MTDEKVERLLSLFNSPGACPSLQDPVRLCQPDAQRITHGGTRAGFLKSKMTKRPPDASVLSPARMTSSHFATVARMGTLSRFPPTD